MITFSFSYHRVFPIITGHPVNTGSQRLNSIFTNAVTMQLLMKVDECSRWCWYSRLTSNRLRWKRKTSWPEV